MIKKEKREKSMEQISSCDNLIQFTDIVIQKKKREKSIEQINSCDNIMQYMDMIIDIDGFVAGRKTVFHFWAKKKGSIPQVSDKLTLRTQVFHRLQLSRIRDWKQ